VRLLLDTNALIWFLAAEFMEPEALVAITEAQKAGSLYLSPITAWEAALALNKANPARRPNLNGQDAATWFQRGCSITGAKIVRIGSRIALEAARVPLVSGNGDPGDCFIIATARVSKLAVVTRDGNMQRLSAGDHNYLGTIPC
jgi:PIN domain nuclease of toxin-antitoxin system